MRDGVLALWKVFPHWCEAVSVLYHFSARVHSGIQSLFAWLHFDLVLYYSQMVLPCCLLQIISLSQNLLFIDSSESLHFVALHFKELVTFFFLGRQGRILFHFVQPNGIFPAVKLPFLALTQFMILVPMQCECISLLLSIRDTSSKPTLGKGA